MEKKSFDSSSSSSSSPLNMISPSSSFKPKLNDLDYMELVCENGQILAKSGSGFFQNRHTQSLLDLYETEYGESFKNNIKNHGDTQVVPVNESQQQQDQQINKRYRSSTLIDDSAKNAPPDEQSVAVGRSSELYFASSSMVSRGASSDLSGRSLKGKYEDIEEEEVEEESTYLSNNSDDESGDAKIQVLRRTRKTKRKRSTEVSRLSERKRRDDINKKMRVLQDLLPNCYKEDKASLLDEAIKYMRTLQLQVQMMSMGNGVMRPPTMLPLMSHYYPCLHMNPTAMPQFVPMNVHGAAFPGINNASPSQMLSFLNQPTGLLPNSPIFYPMEHSSQQFVVPSCVPQTQATTSFTQFPKSASTSNLEDSMQFRGRNGYYRSLN